MFQQLIGNFKLYRSLKLIPAVEQLIVLPNTEAGLALLLQCKRIKLPEALNQLRRQVKHFRQVKASIRIIGDAKLITGREKNYLGVIGNIATTLPTDYLLALADAAQRRH